MKLLVFEGTFMRMLLLFVIALSSLAVQATELSVYTSRKEHLVKGIFEKYTKMTGVKINYKTGKAGALIQNLKAEGSKSPADLFITVDAGNLGHAAEEGLLASIESEKLVETIPSHLRDPKNRWFGLSVRARTLVINNKKIDASKTTFSYEDLATSKWKGKLCLRTSKKVYNQSLVAMLISTHGKEKTKKIIAGWVSNNVEIFNNDTAVLNAIAAGRCDVGIVNTYYFGRLMKKKKNLPLQLVWPNQDTSGVHINVSGAGVVKTSKHKKEAIKLLTWLASPAAQVEFAQVNMEYPIIKGIKNDSFVESWGSFKQNSQFELYKASELQKEAIKLMFEVGYK
jgi:iron(III) transport system substrate-binding protein